MIDSTAIGVCAALGSAASWSVGALLFNNMTERLSSFAMTLVKGAMSIALLSALSLFIPWSVEVDRGSYLLLATSGILGISLADTLFFAALRSLGARSIVLLSTVGQVFTVALAVALLGERIGVQEWIGIGLVLTGVTVGVLPGESAQRSPSLSGILLGLGSMLAMAISVILTKRGVASVSTVHATLIRMISGTAGILVLGLATGRVREWMAPVRGMALIKQLFVAVCVITFGGFWLTIVAFKFTSVAIASSLISTEPLFILPLSVIFLKERVTPRSVVGAVVATAGVATLLTATAAG